MQKVKMPEATESTEQQRLFQWARMASGKWPDLCLPVSRGECHGLYIELKREKSGRATPEQTAWMEALLAQGYAVSLCHGWEAAAEVLKTYLEGKP